MAEEPDMVGRKSRTAEWQRVHRVRGGEEIEEGLEKTTERVVGRRREGDSVAYTPQRQKCKLKGEEKVG